MLHKGQGFQSSWPAALTGKHTVGSKYSHSSISVGDWYPGPTTNTQVLLSFIVDHTHNTTSEDAEPIDVEGRL